MATLPTLPPSGSEDWYAHYSGLHSQGDAQEATLASHASRLSALEGAPAVPLSGVVQVDSFAGATDDIKLDAALLYASQQTRIPYVQMPPRDFTWNKPGRIPFSGMKIIGPNSPGWKNLELASGKYVNHRVSFGAAIGVGNNAAFNGNGQTLYDIYIANLAFAANNNGQPVRRRVQLHQLLRPAPCHRAPRRHRTHDSPQHDGRVDGPRLHRPVPVRDRRL
jgi:hypothetical protein